MNSETASTKEMEEPLGGVEDYIVQDTDEFLPLSGKPYFNVFLAKSQLEPLYKLFVPSRMDSKLPDSNVPAILTYRAKEWKITFCGGGKIKMFDSRWRDFAIDNNLKVGDACLFEIMEFTDGVLKLRVQIYRNEELPSEVLSTPIVIDDDDDDD